MNKRNTILLLAALSACLVSTNPLRAQDSIADAAASAPAGLYPAGSPAAMMLAGHNSRAVWENFPGFTADLVVITDSASHSTKLRVESDFEYSYQLPADADEPWVDAKLRSVISHRRPDDAPAYDVVFLDHNETSPIGRLIGQRNGSGEFRIQDGVIREVHRKSETSWMEITNVEQFKTTNGQFLPETTSVTFRDPGTGNLKSNGSNRFTWTQVGDFYLPESSFTVQVGVDGEREIRELHFSNHKLLPAE
ncbi:DUF3386 family protein [Allorhodopirellula heiligendammensis]|uniref:DUF3386 domain-containing protein n=1 Tax=Allorhodopirellula heiligendammensis TaxID=2714739 RepID=A0A5C6C4I3_9BACT|nr:DUF3386 family protein [Allorhodopirellula heiligendammensis]TWU19520.1 hypothetical protein Poly21_16930 [Allorhodopirellula heiligendammensis]